MLKKTVICSSALALLVSQAHAQSEASESGAVSESVEVSNSGVQADGEGGGFAAYNERYKPMANTWELGVFTGLLFPSDEHNIFAPREGITQEPYAGTALELGMRVGYFPLAFLGIEGSGFASPTEVDSGRSAMLYGGDLVLVGQLPSMSLTPFLYVGGGVLGGISETMGNDMDPAIVAGVGLKAPLSNSVALRVDLRDTLTQKYAAADGDQTHSPAVLLGVTAVLGRGESTLAATLAPDSDRDGLADAEDKCPRVAALSPDGCPLDTDDDGVVDADDYCPREAGDKDNGCPDPDKDGDGVPVPCDKCADEKGVAPDGCPIRDQDGDGFMDDVDQCSDKPETKNGYQDGDGCPDEVPTEVQKFSGTIEGILFQQNEAKILPRSFKTLDEAVAVLTKYPEIKLEISGHTSSEGDAERNKKLSLDRADAVKAYLVGKGIDEKRVQTRGAGSSEPVADEKQPGGMEKNRRIEFKVIPQ